MASGNWSQKNVGGVNASGSWSVTFSRENSTSKRGSGIVSVTLNVPNGDEMWWYANWSCGGKSGQIILNERWQETISGSRTRTASFTIDGLADAGGNFSFSLNVQRWNDVSMIGELGNASGTVSYGSIQAYTITYNANGGSNAPASQTKYHGTNIGLSSAEPTRNGYEFKGWATSQSGSVVYAKGATYSVNASVTLYAVWEAKSLVYVATENGWKAAIPYISTENGWKQAVPYVSTENGWKLTTN